MRKIVTRNSRLRQLFLSLLFLQHFNLAGQWVTIPDNSFVDYLTVEYPACMSGNQMDTTCIEITTETFVSIPMYISVIEIEGIQYFDSLITLWVDSGTLNSIPPTINRLSKLEYLKVNNNQLTSLPDLPDSLGILQIGANYLTSLPDLPEGLWDLNMGENLVTSLPDLPPGLTHLYCNNNPLTSLPDLPETLGELHTQNCQLNSLPDLPPNLYHLNCSNNFGLTCLPILPESLTETGFSPPGHLQFPGTGITCIPNMPDAALSSALPICIDGDVANNPNNCPALTGILGYASLDNDLSCDHSYGDESLQNLNVMLIGSSGTVVESTTTLVDGSYHFESIPLDNYIVRLDTSNTPFINCGGSPLEIAVDFTTGTTVSSVNFSLDCDSYDLGTSAVTPIGWVFPGEEHLLKIATGDLAAFYSASCTSALSGSVEVAVSGPIIYQSEIPGSATPNSVSSNVFTYLISDFGSIDFFNHFGLRFACDTTASDDDTICVTVTIQSSTSDEINLSNNVFEFCYPVVNSYDPNDKQVSLNKVSPGFDDWLQYTIRFQNTGSAPAFNIKLKDTLSSQFDIQTFRLLNYSHTVSATISNNLLSFYFNDIMLPDSNSNPEGSIGFVQFKIKLNEPMILNDQVDNRAYIYFDFNPPIITNYATTICTSSKTFDDDGPTPYPNPSSTEISFYLPEGFVDNQTNIYILSPSGAILKAYNFITDGLINIDISELNSGVYFIRATSNGQEVVSRFIKF